MVISGKKLGGISLSGGASMNLSLPSLAFAITSSVLRDYVVFNWATSLCFIRKTGSLRLVGYVTIESSDRWCKIGDNGILVCKTNGSVYAVTLDPADDSMMFSNVYQIQGTYPKVASFGDKVLLCSLTKNTDNTEAYIKASIITISGNALFIGAPSTIITGNPTTLALKGFVMTSDTKGVGLCTTDSGLTLYRITISNSVVQATAGRTVTSETSPTSRDAGVAYGYYPSDLTLCASTEGVALFASWYSSSTRWGFTLIDPDTLITLNSSTLISRQDKSIAFCCSSDTMLSFGFSESVYYTNSTLKQNIQPLDVQFMGGVRPVPYSYTYDSYVRSAIFGVTEEFTFGVADEKVFCTRTSIENNVVRNQGYLNNEPIIVGDAGITKMISLICVDGGGNTDSESVVTFYDQDENPVVSVPYKKSAVLRLANSPIIIREGERLTPRITQGVDSARITLYGPEVM